jgi:hypothetical protein
MIFHLKDPFLPLNYNSRFDEYSIARIGSSVQVILFCPFCGGELPQSRRDQFFDELEAAKIDFDLGDDESKLPYRFKQDLWWETPPEKKRSNSS